MNQSILNQVHTFIEQHSLIPTQSVIVLGLSGGPDSVFLFHVLAELHQHHTIKLIAAHLDHEWRAQSAQDVEFCRDMAHKLNIHFVTAKISELINAAAKFNGSKEEFGRNMRRIFLEKIRKEHNADLIALAHHAQDQQETFFIRLIRGSSLTGLTAMKPKYGVYIRPLLEINKVDILTYLDNHPIPYLVDPTNIEPEFLRNRIRTTVLPALQACDSRFDKNFLNTLHRLQETETFLEQLTAETFDTIATYEQEKHFINLKELLNVHHVVLYRILIHWLLLEKVPFTPTQGFLDEIIRFFKQPGSKEHKIHEAWILVKKKESVHIQRI